MSNTIYKKDLHDVALAVAQGSKNYTDKTKEEIYWHIGDYSISTQSDNTTASTKTVPTGATRCKIKKIYGLTEKFNPSVAYDDASTMTKTMPNVVYDFDCSVVYGNSEVSENKAVFDDVAETTINGVKVKYQDGGVYLDGTANAQFKVVVQFKQPIYANQDYYVKLFTSGTTTATNPKAIGETSSDARLLIPPTTTFNVAYNINYFWFSVGANSVWTNYTVKPMIVKGTTAPTEFSVGFEGIHNIELSGLKVEGANVLNPDNTFTYSTYTDLAYFECVGGATYTLKSFGSYTGSFSIFKYDGNSWSSIETHTLNSGYTITAPSDAIRIGVNGVVSQSVMAVRGSTPPTTYQPYIAPTTIPIDLSTILYNGSPLFEDNSLKGVGTAKDYITPYKAHKEVGTRAYQSGDEEDSDVLTDGTTTLYPLVTPIEVSIDWSSTLRGITGYSNGTITLLNTYNMDTANTITYSSMIKENCCAKIVQSRGGNVVKTINLPTVASDGYSAGSVNNYRDLTTSKRIGNVDKNNNLGSFNYTYYNNNIFGTQSVANLKAVTSNNDVANILCDKYENNTANHVWSSGYDLIIAINTSSQIQVKDTSYTDPTIFKTAMANEPLYYELADASKTETDIDAIENVIEVEPNDIISFLDENDNVVNVPSDLTYRIEVERV